MFLYYNCVYWYIILSKAIIILILITGWVKSLRVYGLSLSNTSMIHGKEGGLRGFYSLYASLEDQ